MPGYILFRRGSYFCVPLTSAFLKKVTHDTTAILAKSDQARQAVHHFEFTRWKCKGSSDFSSAPLKVRAEPRFSNGGIGLGRACSVTIPCVASDTSVTSGYCKLRPGSFSRGTSSFSRTSSIVAEEGVSSRNFKPRANNRLLCCVGLVDLEA